GALRVYQPGFSTTDDPFLHPLLLPVRLTETKQRIWLAKRLALSTVRSYREESAYDSLREERSLQYDRSRRAIADRMTAALKQATDRADYEGIAIALDSENQGLRSENDDL